MHTAMGPPPPRQRAPCPLALAPPEQWRWRATTVEAGLNRNGDHIAASTLDELAAMLPGAPVRWALDKDHDLIHPARDRDPRAEQFHVGQIEAAQRRPWTVSVILRLDATCGPLQRALQTMYERGALRWRLGLSLAAECVRDYPRGTPVIVRWLGVKAVDIVRTPASAAARIHRPVAPDEFALGHQEAS